MVTWVRRNAAAFSLFLLAPAVGELLSGSAPPAELLDLSLFLLLVGLYGSGALLVRELARGWGKGYPTVLCLGAAYGIFVEAIVCKSWFDPHWPDLGELATYGWVWRTNCVWAVWITVYHTVISIAVPILLVEVLFPHRRTETWLSRPTRLGLVTVLFLEALVGYLGAPRFRPPWPQYPLAWAAMLALIALAPHLPNRLGALPQAGPRWRPAWLWAVGLAWVPVSFLAFTGLPKALPPVVPVILGLGVAAGASWLVLRLSGNLAQWDDRGRFALGAGVLSFFIALTPLQEMGIVVPPGSAVGMSLVGLGFLLLLLWQGRRVWRRRTAVAGMPSRLEVTAESGSS